MFLLALSQRKVTHVNQMSFLTKILTTAFLVIPKTDTEWIIFLQRALRVVRNAMWIIRLENSKDTFNVTYVPEDSIGIGTQMEIPFVPKTSG